MKTFPAFDNNSMEALSTYPAFSDATIDIWGSLASCKGDGPERGTSGAMFCSVFAVMPATCNDTKGLTINYFFIISCLKAMKKGFATIFVMKFYTIYPKLISSSESILTNAFQVDVNYDATK